MSYSVIAVGIHMVSNVLDVAKLFIIKLARASCVITVGILLPITMNRILLYY